MGPGTIIGSAAFNLMVTTAICIASVPRGEVRKIHQLQVYITTTAFSLFAYLWLIFILSVWSPEVIEIWEAAVTFCMFPVLVVSAYMAERKSFFCCRRGTKVEEFQLRIEESSDNSELNSADLQMLKNLTPTEVAQWKAKQIEDKKPKSQAYYRSHRPSFHQSSSLIMGINKLGHGKETPKDSDLAMVQFASASYVVREADGQVKLKLIRSGNDRIRAVVKFKTVEGTASENEDFLPEFGCCAFEPGLNEQFLSVTIVESNEIEADEYFTVELATNGDQMVKLGETQVAKVTIMGEADRCLIEVKERRQVIKESSDNVKILVQRKGKASEKTTVSWKTVDGTARNQLDYRRSQGELVFDIGEVEQTAIIPLINTVSSNKRVTFTFILTSVNDSTELLGAKKSTVITIISDEDLQQKLLETEELVGQILNDKKSIISAWRQQFISAMNVNGGDLESAVLIDYFLHAVGFGWKFAFAFVPPPEIFGGYLTFIFALIIVGTLTSVVGDMAQIFGCLCGLEDVVIAAVLVSVGTNLPDVFASRFAAIQDKVADHAIGHITGSNCINVFLGLGLPWLIASVYWHTKGKSFKVDSEGIGWCVVIYSILSVISMGILILRRKLKCLGKAELGGPRNTKLISSALLVAMWIGYLVFTYFQSNKLIPNLI